MTHQRSAKPFHRANLTRHGRYTRITCSLDAPCRLPLRDPMQNLHAKGNEIDTRDLERSIAALRAMTSSSTIAGHHPGMRLPTTRPWVESAHRNAIPVPVPGQVKRRSRMSGILLIANALLTKITFLQQKVNAAGRYGRRLVLVQAGLLIVECGACFFSVSVVRSVPAPPGM